MSEGGSGHTSSEHIYEHQHSHNHLGPRTTFRVGGQEPGQERGRHRQRIPQATCDVRARRARTRLRLGAHRAAGPQHPLLPALLPACCHCLALPAMPHFTLLLPAMPGPRPSAALYTGRREIPRLARPAWPLSPALCVCVCVGCVMLDVPVDVPLAFGSAVVCYAIASAFCCFGHCFALALGFGFGCSCGLLLAQPPLYAVRYAVPVPPPTNAPQTHCTYHTPTMPDITPPTPRFTLTPHPHHTTSTHTHTVISTNLSTNHRLVLAPASLRWHTVYSVPCMCLGCTLCFDQVS
jgi:hypothetical protein